MQAESWCLLNLTLMRKQMMETCGGNMVIKIGVKYLLHKINGMKIIINVNKKKYRYL